MILNSGSVLRYDKDFQRSVDSHILVCDTSSCIFFLSVVRLWHEAVVTVFVSRFARPEQRHTSPTVGAMAKWFQNGN